MGETTQNDLINGMGWTPYALIEKFVEGEKKR